MKKKKTKQKTEILNQDVEKSVDVLGLVFSWLLECIEIFNNYIKFWL